MLTPKIETLLNSAMAQLLQDGVAKDRKESRPLALVEEQYAPLAEHSMVGGLLALVWGGDPAMQIPRRLPSVSVLYRRVYLGKGKS